MVAPGFGPFVVLFGRHGADESDEGAASTRPSRNTRRTDPFRTVSEVVGLSPSLEVCFTGSAVDHTGAGIDRNDLETLATRHGLVPKPSVTKKGCGLVVAADAATQSSKADKARQWGIQIVSVDDFLSALRTNGQLSVTRREVNALALVCVQCGNSWKAKRRSREPVCADCWVNLAWISCADAVAIWRVTLRGVIRIGSSVVGDFNLPSGDGKQPGRDLLRGKPATCHAGERDETLSWPVCATRAPHYEVSHRPRRSVVEHRSVVRVRYSVHAVCRLLSPAAPRRWSLGYGSDGFKLQPSSPERFVQQTRLDFASHRRKPSLRYAH